MAEQKLLENDLTFASFDFDPRLARAIAQLNFVHPTLVQAKAIPLALEGKDILARARTGSGKTAAYAMPIVQKILTFKESVDTEPSIKALILVPTRELAEQVTSHINRLLVYAKQAVKVINLAAQVSPEFQRPILAEKPDIVVSTPSRVCIHLEAKNMELRDSLQNLVIDEADLVLSFGYEEDLHKLLKFLPKIYQSFLMSATLTSEIEALKQLVLRKPAVLKLEEDEDGTEYLTQYVIRCSEFEKFLYTFIMIKLRLIRGKVILFVNDIDRCYKVKLFLEQFSIKSAVLNSELPINSRYNILEQFNRGMFDYLIATDESELKGEQDSEDEESAAEKKNEEASKAKKSTKVKRDKEYGVARGVDFQGVAAVINFDFPLSAKAYTHRVGRTARGGKRGMSLSFVVPNDQQEHDKSSVRSWNVNDEKVFSRVEKQQNEKGAELKQYAFDKKSVEGFSYRVSDAIKAVSKVAVKEARIAEIKHEMLNSEKLKSHFEDRPKDLEFLRHDKALQPMRVQKHLKHIPSYLMPRIASRGGVNNADITTEKDSHVPFHSEKRRRTYPSKHDKKRKQDPLKSIRMRR